MIDVNAWMEQFLQALHKTFSGRIWFVGLQGSYARGEATEHSDIDTVLILDELNPQDIQSYHAMLDSLPHRELVCGFLSGKTELLH
jgi:predicted nucleotidyltransferase